MRDGLRIGQSRTDGIGGALDDDAMKGAIKARVALHIEFLDDLLRREIAAWRIMLMQRMHRHASGKGACGPCQRGSEGIMSLIGNADPIHRAEHDGLLRAEDDNTPAAQRQVIHTLHRIISHRRTQRRCGINIKGGEAQRLRCE